MPGRTLEVGRDFPQFPSAAEAIHGDPRFSTGASSAPSVSY
jgi:hypothetical protein